MLLRLLSIIFFIATLTEAAYGQLKTIGDPSGVYVYEGETVEKNDDIYGYSGTVMVLLKAPGKIIVNLYVNKGAPSYNLGTLIDTLDYSGNTALFLDTSESACKLIFHFYKKKLFVEMFAKDPNFACGFGHAVSAQGVYRKLKGRRPTVEEILTDGATGSTEMTKKILSYTGK